MIIDCILVIYNSYISKNDSYCKFMNKPGIRFIVCDNSTSSLIKKCNAIALANTENIYVDMHGNAGLAKAYNAAICISNAKFICLMDDDTYFPENFFQKSIDWILNNDGDIYLPIIKALNGKIMSPCMRKKYKFASFHSIEDIRPPFSAINSGMILRKALFEHYRYDERFFLDLIDHQFMRDMQHKKIVIMKNIVLKQHFSFYEDNYEQAKKRLSIYKRDSKIYYSYSFFEKIFRLTQIGYRYLKIYIKYIIRLRNEK